MIVRLASFFAGTPCIYTVHGWSFSAFKGIKRRLMYALEWLILPFSSALLFVSEFDYLSSPRHLLMPRTSVIYNTVSCDPTSVSLNSHVAQIRREFVLNSHTSSVILFCSVCRLSQQKDVYTILRSLSIINRSYNNWHYFVVGDGPLLNKLSRLSKQLGLSDNVTFLGYLKDPLPVIKSCDVFILSSKWEGFPITTLEAMALSKPVVVSRTCGSVESVLPSYNGYIFTQGNPDDLAAKLVSFFEDPSLIITMGVNSRHFLIRRFHRPFSNLVYKVLLSLG